ncbi:MAG TPA: cysteine hydrolase [Xanthobacteraceae bacterium]|nr:cysteine hydrolase [Xanthobacteraceae bacterium]
MIELKDKLGCAAVALMVAAALSASMAAAPAWAGDIVAEWATVKPPPVPELKPVTIDPKTTALLILDLMKTNCGERPRCTAMVPNVRKLHDAARAANMMVFYTLVGPPGATPADMVPGITPRDGEWVYQRGPDKYLGSDLEKRLKDKGIKTVIITGTSAQGVVIGTGSGSAQRGYKVIVPVDGMASEDPYMEQYAAWHMYKGGPAIITEHVTVTRSDMIKFAD